MVNTQTEFRIVTHLMNVVNEHNLTIQRFEVKHLVDVIRKAGIADLVTYAITHGDLQTAADIVNATHEM
jgi:hypothetical protein